MANATYNIKFTADTGNAKSSFSSLASSVTQSSAALARGIAKIENELVGLYDKMASQQTKVDEAMLNKTTAVNAVSSSIAKLQERLNGLRLSESNLQSEFDEVTRAMDAELDSMRIHGEGVAEYASEIERLEGIKKSEADAWMDAQAQMEEATRLYEHNRTELEYHESEFERLSSQQASLEDRLYSNANAQQTLVDAIEREKQKLIETQGVYDAKVDDAARGMLRLAEEQEKAVDTLEKMKDAEKQAFKAERVEAMKAQVKALGDNMKALLSIIARVTSAVGSTMVSAFSKVASALNPFNLFKSVQGLLVGGAIGVGFKKASDAADELADAMGLVNSAFGDNASSMHQWASNVAKYFGIATGQAETYFGQLGEYLKNVGVDTDMSEVIAKNFVAKSGELSRSYGVSVDEAFEALRKGVTANSAKGAQGLKALGVALTDDAIAAELLADGITKDYKDLTDAEKIIVKYNVAMRQLGDVTGSTAGEFGNWEGAIAGITSNAKDALASLGQIIQYYLLPVASVLAQIMASVAGAIASFAESMGITTANSMGISAYSDAVGEAGDAIEDAGEKSAKANKQLAGFDKLNNLTEGTSGIKNIAKTADALGEIKPINLLGAVDMSNLPTLDDWLDKLKNADFNGTGRYLGKQISKLLGKLNGVGSWLKTGKLGDAIGAFLKGLTDENVWGNTVSTLVELGTGLLVTLGKSLAGNDWAETARQIVTGLVTSISNNKGEIVGAAKDIAGSLGDFLVGAFDPKNMKALGSEFADVVNGVVDSGAVSDLTKGIATMVLGIFEFIKTAFLSINWGELASEILKGIGEAIMENPGTFLTGLGAWLVWSNVKHLFVGLVDIGTSVGGEIAAGISATTATGGVLAVAVAGVAAIVKSGIDQLEEYVESVKRLNDAGSWAQHWVDTKITEESTGMLEKNADDLNKAGEKLGSTFDKAAGDYNTLVDTIANRPLSAGVLTKDIDEMDVIYEYLKEMQSLFSDSGVVTSSTEMLDKVLQEYEEIDPSKGGFLGIGSSTQDEINNAFSALTEGLGYAQKGMDDFNASAELYNKTQPKFETALLSTDKAIVTLTDDDKKAAETIELLANTDVPAFKDSLNDVKQPLDDFLEQMEKVSDLNYDGKFVDTDTLRSNMDEAVRIVKSAVKDMNDAVAEATNLKNFEATLSSTQTIKVDSSGTQTFKFDITTKPDKDSFNSWQEKYALQQSYSVGTK